MALTQRLFHLLSSFPSPNRWIVAYSGGADSTALLKALSEIRGLGHKIVAFHINHGLHVDADQWTLFGQEIAEKLGIEFLSKKVQVNNKNHTGIEAAAREARYEALNEFMLPNDIILTAHHAKDQVETFLMQCLRGSGPNGLRGMPELIPFGKGWLGRPFLKERQKELEKYLKNRRINWIEDPSNNDRKFDRNYIRHQILPLIKDRWPDYEKLLHRTTRLLNEAQENLDDLARIDMLTIETPQKNQILITELQTLSWRRVKNVIRYWLTLQGADLLHEKHFAILYEQVIKAKEDAVPLFEWNNHQIRRYRQRLYYYRKSDYYHDPNVVLTWENWRRSSIFIPSMNKNISVDQLKTPLNILEKDMPRVTIRFRVGGEKITIHGKKKVLKKYFQEIGIPPWERARIPLLYLNEELIEVIGY